MSMADQKEKTKGELPTNEGMFFETYLLVPEENITGPELVAILTALQINFSKAIWNSFPNVHAVTSSASPATARRSAGTSA